jgi:Fic family protein
MDRMRRTIAIETGVIERLYTIDQGTTLLLIEHGIDESLIPHNATDRPKSEVVALIRDQSSAVDHIFDFVGSQRELSTSYIKSLHQLLTRNQDSTEAIDQFGNRFQVSLRRGEWKQQPNNPLRPDGVVYEYCPPEQVASQMDDLLRLHREHEHNNIPPEIEAAWFHHRFTQIHPFQDGNGRVARLLASLILIKAGWFPLVVKRDDKVKYIEALEAADAGSLEALVSFFAKAQRRAFVSSISLSENVLTERATVQATLDSIKNRLEKDKAKRNEDARAQAAKAAKHLQSLVDDRLEDLKQDTEQALRDVLTNYVIRVTRAGFGDENDYYFYNQIIEDAKKFDYFANLSEYKAWSRLSFRNGNTQTDIIFAIHAVGRDVGVMVCSPLAFRKTIQRADHISVDDENQPLYRDLEVLSDYPFQFTHLQDEKALETSFRKWLENVLVLALAYWQQTL